MKIAVVGSMNMDMIIHADKLPKKGETIKGKKIEYQPGGKGANQAVAMAKLGADVTMFGCVGNDTAGKRTMENMKRWGVNTEYIRVLEGIPTGQAIITIGENDNTIVVIDGANGETKIEYIRDNLDKILKFDVIVLQNEIPEETVEYVIRLCRQHQKIIVWNPAPAKQIMPELVNMTTYIIPNENEVQVIWGHAADDIGSLLKRYPEKLIITQGSKGVSMNTEGENVTIPAMKTDVKDTTGAGDTFNGAFCVGIAMKMSKKEALRFANTAAGLSVRECGAQKGMPGLSEVKEALKLQF